MAEKVSISVKQGRLLQALLAGHPIVTAAKIAGVAEQTAHRWLKDEVFQQAYKQAKDELFEDALDELKVGMHDAIAGLRKHLAAEVEPTAATQIAAIRIWVESGITIHKADELEARITELEEEIHRGVS